MKRKLARVVPLVMGDVVIGDVDGNGKPDIVVIDADRRATMLLH